VAGLGWPLTGRTVVIVDDGIATLMAAAGFARDWFVTHMTTSTVAAARA
jgi:predicted phosphoribosyltransferase